MLFRSVHDKGEYTKLFSDRITSENFVAGLKQACESDNVDANVRAFLNIFGDKLTSNDYNYRIYVDYGQLYDDIGIAGIRAIMSYYSNDTEKLALVKKNFMDGITAEQFATQINNLEGADLEYYVTLFSSKITDLNKNQMNVLLGKLDTDVIIILASDDTIKKAFTDKVNVETLATVLSNADANNMASVLSIFENKITGYGKNDVNKLMENLDIGTVLSVANTNVNIKNKFADNIKSGNFANFIVAAYNAGKLEDFVNVFDSDGTKLTGQRSGVSNWLNDGDFRTIMEGLGIAGIKELLSLKQLSANKSAIQNKFAEKIDEKTLTSIINGSSDENLADCIAIFGSNITDRNVKSIITRMIDTGVSVDVIMELASSNSAFIDKISTDDFIRLLIQANKSDTTTSISDFLNVFDPDGTKLAGMNSAQTNTLIAGLKWSGVKDLLSICANSDAVKAILAKNINDTNFTSLLVESYNPDDISGLKDFLAIFDAEGTKFEYTYIDCDYLADNLGISGLKDLLSLLGEDEADALKTDLAYAEDWYDFVDNINMLTGDELSDYLAVYGGKINDNNVFELLFGDGYYTQGLSIEKIMEIAKDETVKNTIINYITYNDNTYTLLMFEAYKSEKVGLKSFMDTFDFDNSILLGLDNYTYRNIISNLGAEGTIELLNYTVRGSDNYNEFTTKLISSIVLGR